jgi:hypothetical protein
MQNGTVDEAKALAKQRWAQLFAFDLDETTWSSLFSIYRPGEVLEGIRLMRNTRDPRPEKVFARFQQTLERNQTKSLFN